MNKNLIAIIFAGVIGGALVSSSLTGCTDMSGDGIDSIVWNGSTNPENTAFHSPVWEPSLEAGTVYRGASLYVALSSETQWTPGLSVCVPAITSGDLMKWTNAKQNAFSYDSKDADGETVAGTRPAWTTSRITSISADFAKTIASTPYWMVYAPEGENAIGVAYASTQQGPFVDAGKLLTAADLGATTLSDPYIAVFTTKCYLLYTTDQGSFVQELSLKKATLPTLKNAPVKVAGPEFKDVALYRTDASNYYLFGTVKGSDGATEIRYARGEKATGPFLDKKNNDIATSGTGELLIEGNSQNVNPENVCRVFENADGVQFVAYNATAVGKEAMMSGYARRPLFLSPGNLDADGWFESVLTPTNGWVSPRFN